MASIVILYENFADTGILSGGLWLAALPLTNLQDADVQRVARSTNATTGSTKFVIDLGRAQVVDGIAFGPTNISPGATWRARGYTDVGLTALVYDTTTQTVVGEVIDWSDSGEWLEWEDPGFWYGIPDTLDELPQFLFHVVPAGSSSTAQYWLVEITDTGNADGSIDIGRLLIARAFRPSVNYDESNELSMSPLTDMEESLGGLRVFWERGLRRTFRAQWPSLGEDELFGDFFRMMLRSGISRQVFVVPDPEDTEFGPRRSFLATFKQIPAIQQLLIARGTTAVDVEEVL